MNETINYRQEAAGLQDQLVQWRRALHQIPETGICLPQTMEFIRQRLEEMEIPYRLHPEISCIEATIGSGGNGNP